MRWPPYKHIFFDCDSTLTAVEGIDALADASGKSWRVGVLTDAAMSGDVNLEEIYAKRLRTLRPTRGQVRAIHKVYKQHVVPDVVDLITALQLLEHQVYIISGGLAEPVHEFGRYLGVPPENIRAVGIEYDSLSGEWWYSQDEQPNVSERYLTFDQVPLTVSDGKARIVSQILADQSGRSLLIGDGVSDLLAGPAVDLFVGFGGVIDRRQVHEGAPVFITSTSLAPLLAIAAGPAALAQLDNTDFRPFLKKIIDYVTEGAIEFNDEQLQDRFYQAWRQPH
ncbi:MAG: HAD-IB family phosphatase [Chloroflexota bacterium]|nr:MAG: HAD-IB family phosphatase [Chloroflexota bacterium]